MSQWLSNLAPWELYSRCRSMHRAGRSSSFSNRLDEKIIHEDLCLACAVPKINCLLQRLGPQRPMLAPKTSAGRVEALSRGWGEPSPSPGVSKAATVFSGIGPNSPTVVRQMHAFR
jgi:hypothetical protein